MSVRYVRMAGVVIAVVAVVTLALHFIAVGLDKADKLASVGGLFVAVVGLALSVYGPRLSPPTSAPPEPEPQGHPRLPGRNGFGEPGPGRGDGTYVQENHVTGSGTLYAPQGGDIKMYHLPPTRQPSSTPEGTLASDDPEPGDRT